MCNTNKDRMKAIRLDNGDLPAYAWPGGYPIFYIDCQHGEICPTCANMTDKARDEWSFHPVAYGIHYEGAPIVCEHCNKEIESAYGDPDADEDAA